MEINGGGWRWMKSMDGEEDEWVRVKVRVRVRF